MIPERVIDITSSSFETPADRLTFDTRVRELGDELTVVEYFMALEEEFGVEISDEEMERLQTIGDIIDLITKRLGDDL
jgi:acyl carrier protein